MNQSTQNPQTFLTSLCNVPNTKKKPKTQPNKQQLPILPSVKHLPVDIEVINIS